MSANKNSTNGIIFHRYLLAASLMTKPKSARLLAKELNIDSRTIYRYMDALRQAGFEIEKSTKGTTPKYQLKAVPEVFTRITQQLTS